MLIIKKFEKLPLKPTPEKISIPSRPKTPEPLSDAGIKGYMRVDGGLTHPLVAGVGGRGGIVSDRVETGREKQKEEAPEEE